ncbi:MAG: multicopper oxidase domain-containing protein, partial [bacterium]
MHTRTVLFLAAFSGGTGAASPVAGNDDSPAAARAAADAIVANDNQTPGGTLRDGVLTLHLEVRPGALYPEEDNGPSVPTLAFAEVGGPLRVPGPLIRVPRGTEIRVSVRNPFADSTLTVHGVQDHDGKDSGPLVIPSGQTREARFRANAEGTYYYW